VRLTKGATDQGGANDSHDTLLPNLLPRLRLFELIGQFKQQALFSVIRIKQHADGEIGLTIMAQWQRYRRSASCVGQSGKAGPFHHAWKQSLIVEAFAQVAYLRCQVTHAGSHHYIDFSKVSRPITMSFAQAQICPGDLQNFLQEIVR